MNDLRRRLQFHSIKIRLVVDRLSIDLLTDADSRLDGILAITTENLQLSRDTLDEIRLLRRTLFEAEPGRQPPMTQTLLQVPTSIAARFQQGLTINAPATYASELPLAEAFDALYYRFAESLNDCNKSPATHLLLLKCCWLVSQIQQCRQYSEANPAFYYRRAITQVDVALRTRIRRLSSDACSEAVLLNLPETSFEIWPPPSPVQPLATVPQQPDPISIQGMERRIAQIQLSTNGPGGPDVVHVFQHSDQSLYRIALETSTSSGERYIREQPFYAGEHKLIPRYALPTMPDPIPEMAIFSHNQCYFYQFRNYEDLWKFQTSFTGYEVSHDQPEVRFQFGPNIGSIVCYGRVQLWQEPIEYRTQSVTAPFSPPDKRVAGRANSNAPSRKASFAPSLAHTTNYMSTNEALVAENIKRAALVIYTQVNHARYGDRFAIIFLELCDDLFIDREACGCKRDARGYDTCSKLVLGSRKKARLRMRTVYSTESAGVQDPNTFDILPLRLPRHDDFHTINLRETEHVILKFADFAAKRAFDEELQNRFDVRDAQRKHMADTERRFVHLANHPQQQDRPPGSHGLGRQSTVTVPGASPQGRELAPQLARPKIGSPLDLNFAHGTDTRLAQGFVGDQSPLSASPLSNFSSRGSTSRGSRTDSTVNTEPDRSHTTAVPSSSTMAQMSTPLGRYQLGSETQTDPVSNASPCRILDTTTAAVPLSTEPRLRTNQMQRPQQLGPSPHSTAAADSTRWMAPSPAIIPRTNTASTATNAASTEPNAQTLERQESGRRKEPHTSLMTIFKSFRKHPR
jgi:hypothetical protein